jgi:glutamate--glyoxylate aminotransferase
MLRKSRAFSEIGLRTMSLVLEGNPQTSPFLRRMFAYKPQLTYDTLPDTVKTTEYAVRGELYLTAVELQKKGMPIFYTNTGNPHALKQPPLSWPRQVLSLCMSPEILAHPEVTKLYAPDAVARAKEIMAKTPGGLGGYTDSKGLPWVREEIAKYIEKRDGYPSNADNIWITDGASVAVRIGLQCLLRNRNDSILVPIPQYPLYSASIELLGGSLAGYLIDEDNNWGLSMQKLQASIDKERAAGRNPRALVFINPGNPTGNCLSYDQLKELALFAHKERLVLLADEVYQENVYQDERPFVSMKKVIGDLGEPYKSQIELMSFQTVSKGSFGECGLRGGYVECSNIDPKVMAEMYKLSSINLAPNTTGQISMSLMMNGPTAGSPSHTKYVGERQAIIASLRNRAQAMTDGFNSMTNVTCNFTEGAMYSFPRVHLPPKAVQAAKAAGKTPDVFYCLELLKATGISTVPGSGFGQEDNTYHLRTTILPPEEQIPTIIQKFKDFNEGFMKNYM